MHTSDLGIFVTHFMKNSLER